MPRILDCFDAAFLINVDAHKDRCCKAYEQLSRVGIAAERLSAITPTARSKSLRAAEVGLNLSHHAVVSIAKTRGYSNILIFEDDLVLRTDFEVRWKEVVDQAASLKYDLLYFYDWRYHERRSRTALVKIDGTLCAHAYAVSSAFYDSFLKTVYAAHTLEAIDQILLKTSAEKWAVIPNMIGQDAGVSTITQKEKVLRWSSKDG